MTRDLETARAVRERVRELLAAADALDRVPVPVADLVQVAGLTEPAVSILGDSMIAQAPPHVRAALAGVQSKVRALLDRQSCEIHLDPSIDAPGRQAFNRLHEVAHHVLPWQRALVYADDDLALSRGTKLLFEREANAGAADLLFGLQLLEQCAADLPVGLQAVRDLAHLFNASFHATFRRYVETHRHAMAGIVLELSPLTLQPLRYLRNEVIQSAAWTLKFGAEANWPLVLQDPPYAFLPMVLAASVGDTGVTSLRWIDAHQVTTTIAVAATTNRYRRFALLWRP
jgi:hypothetical protein